MILILEDGIGWRETKMKKRKGRKRRKRKRTKKTSKRRKKRNAKPRTKTSRNTIWQSKNKKRRPSSQVQRKLKQKSERSWSNMQSFPPQKRDKSTSKPWTVFWSNPRTIKTLKSFPCFSLISQSEWKWLGNWLNSTTRLISHGPAGIKYLTMSFRFSIWSETQKMRIYSKRSQPLRKIMKKLPWESLRRKFIIRLSLLSMTLRENWPVLLISWKAASFSIRKDFKIWSNLLISCTESQRKWPSSQTLNVRPQSCPSRSLKTCISSAMTPFKRLPRPPAISLSLNSQTKTL